MLKYKKHLSLLLIVIMIISALSGCAPYQARRYFNNNQAPSPSPTQDMSMLNNGVARGNTDTSTSRISATYEVVDFSYVTINPDNLNVKAGLGNDNPNIGTLTSGQKVRVLGKLGDWYTVKLPNSNKIGCIPVKSTSPYNYGATGKNTAGNKNNAPTQGNIPKTTTPAKTTPNSTANNAPAPSSANAGTAAMNTPEKRILDLVNAARAKAGAKALSSNGQLTKLARMKSKDMADNNYFSHQSPTYGSPFDMMKTYGVSYMYAGENIAINQTSDAAFNAWMNSEGHKKNILNPNFTDLGVGIVPKGDGSYIYTQEFIGK